MQIGIPKETYAGEKRVAATPESAALLQQLGFTIAIETAAGEQAKYSDQAYRDAGATIIDDPSQLWANSDIILKLRAPEPAEIAQLTTGKTLIAFIWPAQNPALLKQLADKNITVLAMDSVPRISRAQKMDALSSMANIAGYRAIIEASHHFGRFFTGQITAAGRIQPAKIMVIGAGIAGLSAIATGKSMGAIVRAFDTRPEVKEQVESMDAEFLELDFEEDGTAASGYSKQMSDAFIHAEMQLFAEQAKDVDIIITTALIPGKPAPKLITDAMIQTMKNGSVIVDLAGEQGGNCEGTEADQVIVKHSVTLIGYTDLPSRLATQSSQLYGTNLYHLIKHLSPSGDGEISIDMKDEITRGVTVVKEGELTWPPPVPTLSLANTAKAAEAATTSVATSAVATQATATPHSPIKRALAIGIVALLLYGLGLVAPASLMNHLTIFILSCFIGYMVIWNVSPSLHTPLMSVTNAISSIIIIGALLQISSTVPSIGWFAGIAILLSSINISGGFSVTQRMLKMFQK